MAATGKVIGTVTAVVGEAKATAADGTVRILQVGDPVRSDEAISTSAAGSINVALESGKTLDCGGDVSLTLHESILGVATAASASTGAPAPDVDAIQRAIAAGQDPSQVAAATAAGGAPAAGGADDGGAHEPVILEQSNTASIVTSGFATEGDTLAFPAQQVASLLPAEIVASVAPSVGTAETGTPSIPAAAGFDNGLVAEVNAVADDQPIAPVNVVEPGPAAPVATIEIAANLPVETNNAAPVVVTGPAPESLASDPEEVAESPQPPVVADEPVIVATAPEVNEEVAESPQPPVVADEPVIVATPPEADEEVAESPQPPVVADEPVIVATAPEADEEVAESPQPPVVADEPVIVATAPEADEEVAESPQPPVVADEPVIVATDPQADEEVAESPQPPVVADEPVIVATDPQADEEVAESPQPPVVVTQPEDETVVVTQPEDDTVVVTVPEDTSDLPDSTSSSSASLTYSISANTNQDEQIAMLSIENGENAFQTLVLFGQEGQQKPAAVPLGFGITEDTSIVKLQYIDAFAGNSDSNTGQTAQKIAIKDFALGIDGVDAVLAQENDGVNIGVGRSIELEASVELDMTTGAAGEWSFGEPGASSNIDILDVTANTLDLGDLSGLQIESVEVISLKGSEAQELTLAAEDVLNATGSDTLHIMGGKEDTLKLVGDGWTVVDGDAAAGIQPSYFGWVQVNHANATLLVDPDINISLMG